jgi:hypothetical protein
MDPYQGRQLHQIIFQIILDPDLLCILVQAVNLLDGNIDTHHRAFLRKLIGEHGVHKMAQYSGVLREIGAAAIQDMVLSQWAQLVGHGGQAVCKGKLVCDHLIDQI